MNKPAFSLPRMLAVNTALGLVSPFLTLWFAREVNWVHVGRSAIAGQLYSHWIGGLAHLAMYTLYPRLHFRPAAMRWPAVVAILIAVTAVGCLAASAMLLGLGIGNAAGFWRNTQDAFRLGLVLTFLCAVASFTLHSLYSQIEDASLELRTKELERQRALTLAAQARLSSLESRVHPHFLFNALNSISSLIREDPERAERLIERMATLLRFSLDANHEGFVSLEQERKLVADYLEIEQARFGARLRYSIDVEPGLSHVRVPPMAVQTLVENAVKHSIAPRREGGSLRVIASSARGRVSIAVTDDGPGFRLEEAPAGHGVQLLRDRLKAIYSEQAKLTVLPLERGVEVVIEIPK